MLQFSSQNTLIRMNAIRYVVLLQNIDIILSFLQSFNQFSRMISQFNNNFTSSTIYQSYLIIKRDFLSTSINFLCYSSVIIYCEFIQLLISRKSINNISCLVYIAILHNKINTNFGQMQNCVLHLRIINYKLLQLRFSFVSNLNFFLYLLTQHYFLQLKIYIAINFRYFYISECFFFEQLHFSLISFLFNSIYTKFKLSCLPLQKFWMIQVVCEYHYLVQLINPQTFIIKWSKQTINKGFFKNIFHQMLQPCNILFKYIQQGFKIKNSLSLILLRRLLKILYKFSKRLTLYFVQINVKMCKFLEQQSSLNAYIKQIDKVWNELLFSQYLY
ncbi:unnamed protein product (macronuclear) [Paramecium tetraurelia]|uniref:Transmembrane protein n=1 Tax=Paramecium tetraurelia TaxID=5888 RepID=A0E4L4_PARTE|nr:uncharacterized protein GSPATT00023406001 [Paramecium tetraurelia]CAK90231.1 unnamed protein product [Paramecium tetraurelia]|eukprot:XP_001457628.1 hypothetical protein (macronuclear) [Paramecium tetraurelia strain d4-2]